MGATIRAVSASCSARAGYWSRRINDEHRVVYKVDDDVILIAALRHHSWVQHAISRQVIA